MNSLPPFIIRPKRCRADRTRPPRPPGQRRLARGLRALFVAAAWVAAGTQLAQARTLCDVAFQVGDLPQDIVLGFLDLKVEYQRPKIFPLDAEGRVVCQGLAAGSAAAGANKFDSASGGTLTLSFASQTGVAAASPVLRCQVYAAGVSQAVPGDFPTLTAVQARGTNGAPILPLPTLSVGQIRCGDSVITTTTTTTTSAPSTTTTTLQPQVCVVKFRLATSGSYRRLRFDLDYADAGGRPTAPGIKACHSLTSAALGIRFGEAADTLEVEMVSVPPFAGPVDVLGCDFLPTTGIGQPQAFHVSVKAASDGFGAPTAGLPAVSAASVLCQSTGTTSTTVTTTFTTSTTQAPVLPCGDADGDGTVEASDALVALRAAVGQPSICTFSTRCDADGNGQVTASDALRILQKAVGTEVTLSCVV